MKIPNFMKSGDENPQIATLDDEFFLLSAGCQLTPAELAAKLQEWGQVECLRGLQQ